MSRSLGLSATTVAICLVVVIANLGNNIVAPVLPTIRDYFGASAAGVALMSSGFGLGRLAMDLPAGFLTDRSRGIFTILVMLPAGALADRIGRKKLLIPGLLTIVAGNLYLITGDSVFVFTVSTVLVSMGILGNNMISALVADLVPERRLGRGMGMYRFTCDLGAVLGPFALGLIVDHSGFAAAAIAAASVTLVAIAACMLLIPSRTTPAPARPAAQP